MITDQKFFFLFSTSRRLLMGWGKKNPSRQIIIGLKYRIEMFPACQCYLTLTPVRKHDKLQID